MGFQKIYKIVFDVKLDPNMSSPYTQQSWFQQTWILIIWKWFHKCYKCHSFSGHLVSKKKNLFFSIYFYFLKNAPPPPVWPTLPRRITIFTNLNLHYLYHVLEKIINTNNNTLKMFNDCFNKCKTSDNGRSDERMNGRTDRRTLEKKWSEMLTWIFSVGELLWTN